MIRFARFRYQPVLPLGKRLTADGTYEALPAAQPASHKPVGYRLKQARRILKLMGNLE